MKTLFVLFLLAAGYGGYIEYSEAKAKHTDESLMEDARVAAILADNDAAMVVWCHDMARDGHFFGLPHEDVVWMVKLMQQSKCSTKQIESFLTKDLSE